jgi:hypothetical protein
MYGSFFAIPGKATYNFTYSAGLSHVIFSGVPSFILVFPGAVKGCVNLPIGDSLVMLAGLDRFGFIYICSVMNVCVSVTPLFRLK